MAFIECHIGLLFDNHNQSTKDLEYANINNSYIKNDWQIGRI
jgi:hypothetical protein